MMTAQNNSDDARLISQSCGRLIGKRILGTDNVFEVRCFHIGEWLKSGGETRASFGLQILCAWRIESGGRILVGRGDYFKRGEKNQDPDWEPGSPNGNLQDEILLNLFQATGRDENGTIMNQTADLVVIEVEPQGTGGVALELTGGYTLRLFPTNSRDEDWALVTPPGEPHLVVSGGRVENL